MSMSTTLVNSLHPAATYSPTRRSAFSTRSFSFFSFSSRLRCIFTARRKSLNRFISAISSRVFCTAARCARRKDSSSSAPSNSVSISLSSRSRVTSASRVSNIRAAAAALVSAPAALHAPSPSRRHRVDVFVGAEARRRFSFSSSVFASAAISVTRDAISRCVTAETRSAVNRIQSPDLSTPKNSPSGNGFAAVPPPATVNGSYRSTIDTVFVALFVPARLVADATGSSRLGDSPSSFASSSSSSPKKSSSRSLTGSVVAFEETRVTRSVADADPSIHEPSGARPTVAGGFFSVAARRGDFKVPPPSETSPFASVEPWGSSTNTSTNTNASPSSRHSPTARRAPSARDSSVCLATVLSRRRSSFSRPSSFLNLSHSSGSTSDAPAAICSESASRCSRNRRNSRVWSRRARPPR